jgi:hypothetical protein
MQTVVFLRMELIGFRAGIFVVFIPIPITVTPVLKVE